VQRVVTIAACVLIAVGGAAAGRLAAPRSGLRGHYYTNLTRSGAPIAVTIDRSLSTDTLDNGIAGVWPAYSVEWIGFIVVPEAGTYEFQTISDDGSELEVADQVVVRNGGLHGPQESRGTIDLPSGVHAFRLRYEQAGGTFVLSVKYARSGDPLDDIPASSLLPDAMSLGAYRLRRAMPLVGGVAAVLFWIVAGRTLTRRSRRARESRAWLIDRRGAAIAIIVAVGVVVRIFMMLGSDAILWGDSAVFIDAFGAIRSGRFFDHDPHRTLLYPYFLTAFLIWSGEPPMDQIIVGAQHLLGVMSAVCFFLAGRQVFGSRIALAGALLFTVHTTQLFYEISILSEVLFTLVLAASLVPMVAFVTKPSLRGAIVVGLACAALTLTRPVAEFFFLVPLVAGIVVLKHWRERFKVAAALGLTVAAILLPWAGLNLRQFGFFGVALGRGFGMCIRVFDIDRLPPPTHTKYPAVKNALERALGTGGLSPATFVRDDLRRQQYSTAQADAMMNGFAMEAVREHPWRFAINSVRQWGIQLGGALSDEAICASAQGPYVCSPRTQGHAVEPFLNRPRYADEPVRPWVVAYIRHGQIPMDVVLALAIFGLVAYVAERPPHVMAGVFLALVVAYFTFLPAFGQSPQDRYRVPVDALLFMFAVLGLTRLAGNLRNSASATATARQATLIE
jgi:hypothetical protein